MRSSSGPGIESSVLAVQTNSTLDRSGRRSVMVEKFDVLLGSRVSSSAEAGSPVAAAELVDLVEHDHRVHHFDILERLHQLAGQGPDVGTAVALISASSRMPPTLKR